ncbi:MAG TPA: molybdopterin-dependent oxidoreductase [Tepidisphaeraceae bacterium]|nr:molybdopterin-dependent oxidoreductase [Tepidisphaeraceae bacterium]
MDQNMERWSPRHRRRRSNPNRRTFLRWTGAAGVTALLGACKERPSAADHSTQAVAGAAPATAPAKVAPEMARYPEKTDLILLTDRPPQLETPLRYFRDDITPNDAFFVRWHEAMIPTSVDTNSFRMSLNGHVEQELSLSIDDLRQQFEPVSVVAVNQCSGNGRGLFEPRVPGGQWQNGAMGNATWTGARLKEILEKAKVKPGAVDVSFQGLDRPVLPTTPAFIKSLPFEEASDPDVIVAYEMNNKPLPMLNGFPCRLIVPGWYATYWVKSLNQITVLAEPFKGFWMDKAYRVPVMPNYSEAPDHLAEKTVPISWMTTRSVIVSPESGDTVLGNKPFEINGVAFDGGKGISKVEVSTDGGKTWADAQLDPEISKFSFRRFRFKWTPGAAGRQQLMARATNNAGDVQATQQWNRSGYARDVIEPVEVTVA